MSDWLECWGTYSATGPYNNVVMGGSPAGTLYGLDLTQAKSAGYGNGVRFTYNQENNSLKVEVNLIGYGSNSNNQYIANQKYVEGNFTYDWYIDIYYSTDGGNNYNKITTSLIASHASNQSLAYRDNWHLSNVNWSTILDNLPNDFTNVKIEVRGEDVGLRHQNIYTREQVISTFKPWAIRKNNDFKTLNVESGFFKIRKNNSWVDKSQMLLTESGQANAGTSRIRKNNVFVGQSKIGN